MVSTNSTGIITILPSFSDLTSQRNNGGRISPGTSQVTSTTPPYGGRCHPGTSAPLFCQCGCNLPLNQVVPLPSTVFQMKDGSRVAVGVDRNGQATFVDQRQTVTEYWVEKQKKARKRKSSGKSQPETPTNSTITLSSDSSRTPASQSSAVQISPRGTPLTVSSTSVYGTPDSGASPARFDANISVSSQGSSGSRVFLGRRRNGPIRSECFIF